MDQYKATGKGWQSRINEDLHEKVFIYPMRIDSFRRAC
ncbi:MAG: BrnA antitoxin family protein [Rhizobium giardinii]